MRAHFDEQAVPIGNQRLQAILEAHGFAEYAEPIVHIQMLAVLPPAADRGIVGNLSVHDFGRGARRYGVA